MPQLTLSHTCDSLLPLLEHEFGIPQLWPENSRSSENIRPELDYFSAAAELADKLDRLVYLNCVHKLLSQDAQQINNTYREAFDTAVFRDKTEDQIRLFLGHMAAFKRQDLGSFLACALPVLRSIFQENQSLTNAELSVLNNIKKLSSVYNSHPANIQHLIAEYDRSLAQINAVAEKDVNIHTILRDTMEPHVSRLRNLATDLQALENTFQNQFGADSDHKHSRALLREHKKLERKTRLLSILTDLLPQMVLCLPTNWHDDERLHGIIIDCQELSEKLADIPRVSSMEEALSTDYECEGL